MTPRFLSKASFSGPATARLTTTIGARTWPPLTPNSTLLTDLPAHDLSLHANPNGDDAWKLNFIINGVRDDGTHFEFRKDNVWLTNEGDPAKEIHWNLGPPGLDLLWKDTDANGLPLNPTWRGSPGGKSCVTDSGAGCWDPFKVCPFHSSPLISNNWCIPWTYKCTGATPNDYGRCSSQSPTYDRSWLCGWHVNWFPVTFDGTADSADFSTWPGDGDWHIDFRPNDIESNMGRFTLLAEFDSDETTENFISKFWKNEVDLQMIVHKNTARVIGLMGLDTEHGPPGGHGELHPTYVLQFRAGGSGPPIDRWAFFVRNWGNEGYCGASQHYLDLQLFTLRFPAPHGAEGATSVKFLDAPDLDAGSESDSSWSDFGVSGLSPVQHDANGTFVEMIFHIGPPVDAHFHRWLGGYHLDVWKLRMLGTAARDSPTASASAGNNSIPGRRFIAGCRPAQQSAARRTSEAASIAPSEPKQILATNSNYSVYPIHAAGIQGGPGFGVRSHRARRGQATTHAGDPEEHL